jgi:DNA-binding GntR family transcriptional regulator
MNSEISDLRVERANVTLRELALEKLRDAILNFHFKPGERLVERKLCEELGVSRTVVREVLRHLDAEGLVQVLPNRGPSVATIDVDVAQQIYQLRACLESMAVRELAKAKNAHAVKQLEACLKNIERAYRDENLREIISETQRFYSVIFLESGLTVAWDIVKNLNARINVLRAMTVTSKGRRVTGVHEMREMVKAIAAGDPDAAEVSCRAHVAAANEIAKKRLTEDFHGPDPIDLWLDTARGARNTSKSSRTS